ncbi:MAG: leucyl aminopeptidase family protein [Candidatus Micrarchaeia archaeon]
MKIRFEKKEVEEIETELLVVPCIKGRRPAWSSEILKKSGVEDNFGGEKEKSLFVPVPDRGYRRLLFIGIGKEAKAKIENFREAGGKAYSLVSGKKIKKCGVWVSGKMELDRGDALQAFAEGFALKSQRTDVYKTEKKEEKKKDVEELVIFSEEDYSRRAREAEILSTAQNYARRLDMEPSNVMSPQRIADEALMLAKKYGMDCRVYSRGELEKKGMGGILAVGRGSAKPPTFVRIVYNQGKNLPHIALVGKAITFDSGGISIKPGKGMASMKYDKSGALVLLGVMKALAELKVPVKATLIFGAAENMPDGNSVNPGDIIKSYNGKTIEIINTDAEGRVCLADSVAYAAEMKPALILDMATLTGAANVILGRHGICMMGTEGKAMELLEEAGKETYERVWPLPVWEEYSEMVKSDIADVKNIGSEQGEAGTITAGIFIKEFVGKTPWIHLDIASVDLIEHPGAYLPKGPSARGVRLVTSFIRKWTQKKQ